MLFYLFLYSTKVIYVQNIEGIQNFVIEINQKLNTLEVNIILLQELFLAELTKRAFSECKGYTLDYQNIADVVQSDDKFDFLRQIIPRKITVKQFREIMAKKAQEEKQHESDSEESDEDEEEDEEDVKIVIEDSS